MEKTLMPREKLLQQGVEALSDQELLAIFLRTGIRGIPVMQLSENVLKTFGSLRGLLTASVEDFCKVKGLGKTQYIQLQATKEMTKRYLSQQMEANETISEPYMAIMYFQSELEHWEREVFMVIFLDNQNRLIRTEKMFFGTINQASVHPREVVKAALKCNAAALIIGLLRLPIFQGQLPFPNVAGVITSEWFAPFRRLGQRALYRWYHLKDEVL